MKIKSKLLLLILALITAVLLSIILFAGLQWNINNLEKEQNYLLELDTALHNELYELSSFFHEDIRFKNQLKEYRNALIEKKEAMGNLNKIKSLSLIIDSYNATGYFGPGQFTQSFTCTGDKIDCTRRL